MFGTNTDIDQRKVEDEPVFRFTQWRTGPRPCCIQASMVGHAGSALDASAYEQRPGRMQVLKTP